MSHFDKSFSIIHTYIKHTCNAKTQINEYVPNTHIAETFRDILIACELEYKYPKQFHEIPNAINGGYNILGTKVNANDYYEQDGLFYKRGTFKLSFIELLPNYFDLTRLEANSIDEIHNVYQKLREKTDPIRNKLKLYRIYIPTEYNGSIDYTKTLQLLQMLT